MISVIFNDVAIGGDVGVCLAILGAGTGTLEPGDANGIGIVLGESVSVEQ